MILAHSERLVALLERGVVALERIADDLEAREAARHTEPVRRR